MAGKRRGRAAQHSRGRAVRPAAVPAVPAARAALSSSRAPRKAAVSPGPWPAGTPRREPQPGGAGTRSSLPVVPQLPQKEPTVTAGNKTESAGGTSHKKRLSASVNRFFPPRTTPGKG